MYFYLKAQQLACGCLWNSLLLGRTSLTWKDGKPLI